MTGNKTICSCGNTKEISYASGCLECLGIGPRESKKPTHKKPKKRSKTKYRCYQCRRVVPEYRLRCVECEDMANAYTTRRTILSRGGRGRNLRSNSGTVWYLLA